MLVPSPAVPEPWGPLTIEAAQLSCQCGLQGAAAVQERRLQLSSAAVGQVLLHLAGAAGVALGADPQVLTCREGEGVICEREEGWEAGRA